MTAWLPVLVARMTTPYPARVCTACCSAGVSFPQVTTRNLTGAALKVRAGAELPGEGDRAAAPPPLQPASAPRAPPAASTIRADLIPMAGA
ncbi:MAG TPA: hypothetical protein VMV92_25160 [Streptosporangiaceae bacterium]|nr:hypothetical protein [Streptosporangiaceae bacterium]